jgi:hypothetical protein
VSHPKSEAMGHPLQKQKDHLSVQKFDLATVLVPQHIVAPIELIYRFHQLDLLVLKEKYDVKR